MASSLYAMRRACQGVMAVVTGYLVLISMIACRHVTEGIGH